MSTGLGCSNEMSGQIGLDVELPALRCKCFAYMQKKKKKGISVE